MFNNPYNIIGLVSILVILSFLYSYLARKTKIPSVLMLIFTGVGASYLFKYFAVELPDMHVFLQIFGIVGLILIVLEGSLELKLEKSKLKIIRNAFFSALIIFAVSSGLIAEGINLMYPEFGYRVCLINAIPMAVISSAIAIPSVIGFSEKNKEFIIYESIFSDIIGILTFNFILNNDILTASSFGYIAFDFSLVILVSVVLTVILIFFIDRTRMEIKFVLMLAVLLLLYDIGKVLHLSSLLIILIFGLILNNLDVFFKRRLSRWFDLENVEKGLAQFKIVIGELSFLVRTLFFFIFGFTLQLSAMADSKILITGLIILIILYTIRYIYLRFSKRFNVKPEIFIAPRGLITILLFYSIPEEYSIGLISEGVLFMIILVTSIVMIFGMFSSKKTDKGEDGEGLSDDPPMKVYIGREEIEI